MGLKGHSKAVIASMCKVIGMSRIGICTSVASVISIAPAMTIGIELADASRQALRALAEEALIVFLSSMRQGIGA